MAQPYIVFDSEKGTIIKDARLAGYVGWTDRNSALYSYPYLLTGARRQVGNGMAFDLIALNLESGKVDWSYEIETRNSYFTYPTADTLNFVVKDSRVFIGRSDAKIMSFRHSGASK
jgi:outer membrane protein assembly factor BamB